MLVLEELGLHHPEVIAIAKQVAAKQFAERKAGRRGPYLNGDYCRDFNVHDFVIPVHLPAGVWNPAMHTGYKMMVDRFRKQLFLADRKKV